MTLKKITKKKSFSHTKNSTDHLFENCLKAKKMNKEHISECRKKV